MAMCTPPIFIMNINTIMGGRVPYKAECKLGD